MSQVRATASADPWDEYWRHTREASAHRAGGPQDEVLNHFWSPLLAAFLSPATPSRLLDLACGSGAVARLALQAAVRDTRPAPVAVGLDRSPASLLELRRREPTVRPVVGDARATPFADGSFDLVASQFGVEYAGPQAFLEAARLVAPGGVFAAVVHLKDGTIYRENTANLAAMAVVRESRILPAAKDAFLGELAVRTGKGSRPALRRADAALAAALDRIVALLGQAGANVAGGTISRLLEDILHMNRRRATFDAGEVARWTDVMAREVDSYCGRMSSMLAAAAGESDLDQLLRDAQAAGLAIRMRATLLMGEPAEPAAWALVWSRGERRDAPLESNHTE